MLFSLFFSYNKGHKHCVEMWLRGIYGVAVKRMEEAADDTGLTVQQVE